MQRITVKYLRVFILFIITSTLSAQNYNAKAIFKEQIQQSQKRSVVLKDSSIHANTTKLSNYDTSKHRFTSPIIYKKRIPFWKTKEFVIFIFLDLLLFTFVYIFWKRKKSQSPRAELHNRIDIIRSDKIVPEYNSGLVNFRKKLADSNFVSINDVEKINEQAKEMEISKGELYLAAKLRDMKKDKPKESKKKKPRK